MNLILIVLLIAAVSADNLSRNNIAPLSALSSGGNEYLSMTVPQEYPEQKNGQQGSPQYSPPESSNKPSANGYLPPTEPKQETPQYTPVPDSVEILNPDFSSNNFGQNPSQFVPAANPSQQNNEYVNVQNSMQVSITNENRAYENTKLLPTEYLPGIDNKQTNIYSLPVDSGYYSKQYHQNNVNPEIYLPPSNVEVASNLYSSPNNFQQMPQQPYAALSDFKENNYNNNYVQSNYNVDFEPQKLVQQSPNIYSQTYNTQPVSNEYYQAMAVNSNQYNQQYNENNYSPQVVNSKSTTNQFNENLKPISTEYLPDVTLNSQPNQYVPPNNGQYPPTSNTNSLSTEYLPANTPVNQYIDNNAPKYLPPVDNKPVSNQFLPVIDVNSQVKQYNDSPPQIKQNAVEYLPPTVGNTVNVQYNSAPKNEQVTTTSIATRRYDNDFSKPYSIYNFNTISSTPSPYSYTFSTPQVETKTRSQKSYYDDSSRTERPYFKHSPKLIEIGKSSNTPKWPKIDSFTTPRPFETFKTNSRAQSRQSVVYGTKAPPLANSRSSGIGTLSESQQSLRDKPFESLDLNRFDSLNQDNNNLFRTPQPLDSIQNPFQSINQQDPQHLSQGTYAHTYNGHGHTTESIPILKQTSEMAADGSFSYETLTGDQTHVMQHGHIENLGTDHEEQVIHGSYSYVGDDGKTYTVTYVADANGFRAVGDHIPTPPPIPEAIQRSIDLNLAEEIARGTSTPEYGNQGNGYNNYQGYSSPGPLQERSSFSKDNGYKY